METINLYEGFEGEGEIVLREKSTTGETVIELRLLDFHFNEIINIIPLGEYHAESVKYNSIKGGQGWFFDEWECKRVQEFFDQLIAINPSIKADFMASYNALIQICESALGHSNKLYIEYG